MNSEAMDRFDQVVDEAWGRALRGRPAADRLFYLASEFGDFSLIWLTIASIRGLRSDDDARASLRLAALLLAESAVINQGVKRLFRRTRPTADGPRPHRLRTPSTSSFPSGHATSAFAAASLLSHQDPRSAPAYYALATVVAASRVHVQIHHASDVVAGAAIGTAFARVAQRMWPAPGARRSV